DGGVEWSLRAVFFEQAGMRGIAGKKQGFAFAPENVTIVAALDFFRPALAPMLDLQSGKFEIAVREAQIKLFIPAEFVDFLDSRRGQDIASNRSGDKARCSKAEP